MRDISNASHLAKTQPSLCAEWSCPTLMGFIGFSLWVSVWACISHVPGEASAPGD